MRRIKPVLLLILWLLLLTGCSAEGLYSLTVITDGQHELARDVQGDLLVLGGAATLAEGAAVAGNVHVLLGGLLAIGLALLGLGAAALTRFGLRPFTPAVAG